MAFSSVMPSSRSLVLIGILAIAPAVSAAELPPQDAPAYTGVYRAVTKGRDHQGEDWKYVSEDTVTISVANKQARWDYQKDGKTQIRDIPSRYTTTFGGSVAAGTAVRTRAELVGISWEFGYGTVAKATERPPDVLGTATIAGQECTRLRYISAQYGEPEYCVAKNGIVLRFTNKSADAEASYEATSITDKAPDANRFSTPPELKVEERSPARKIQLPF